MTEESGKLTESNNVEESSSATRFANSNSALERNVAYHVEAKKIAALIFNEYLKNDAPYKV